MKQKLFCGRTRRVLCVLLMLAAMLEISAPFASADDTQDKANSDFTKGCYDQFFCEWKRVTKKSDLPSRDNLWHPIIISYVYNGAEYYFDMSGSQFINRWPNRWVDADKQKYNGTYGFNSKKWSDVQTIYHCPSLNDKNINSFVTMGTSITNVAITYLTDNDEEDRKEPTYLIGRDVDWTNVRDEDGNIRKEAAAQVLVRCPVYRLADAASFTYDEYSDYRFEGVALDTINGNSYKLAEKTYKGFNKWSFITKDSSDKDYYNWNLSDDKLRVVSIEDKDWDCCWVYEKQSVIFSDEETVMDYDNGEFTVWIGTVKNMPTLNSNFTVEENQMLNLDNDVMINEGVTLTISPGASMTIDTTLYNNGTIINYGTVFLLEGGTIRTFCPMVNGVASQNCGKLVCSGKKKRGEGNLVAFQNSTIVFDEGMNLFRVEEGAVVELNGTIVCPNTFVLDNADFRIRDKGLLICQYAMPNGYLTIDEMTIKKSALHSGELASTYPAMKEMNKKEVPVPYILTGSSCFFNDGYFAHLTEPSTTAEPSKKDERSALAEKYLKNPVWPQETCLSDTTWGKWVLSEGTSFRNDFLYYTIPGLSYKMKQTDYQDGLIPPGYIYRVAQFNTDPNQTKAVDAQNPKSFRGQLIEFSNVQANVISGTGNTQSVGVVYDSYYALDGSGWYMMRNPSKTVDPHPSWQEERQLNIFDSISNVHYSYRRLWKNNAYRFDDSSILKEGHYDPISDTFITYDYTEMVQYIEYSDGRVQVYTFSGKPGEEVQLALLGEKAGTGPVDLRLKF